MAGDDQFAISIPCLPFILIKGIVAFRDLKSLLFDLLEIDIGDILASRTETLFAE